MIHLRAPCLAFVTLSLTAAMQPLAAQLVYIDVTPSAYQQQIDGFGAYQNSSDTLENWWQELIFDDLGASIYRLDLTPNFAAPYSDFNYVSPWFMGSGTDSPLNIEDPDNPNGPEGNRVRVYSGWQDYSREFGGQRAPIAVMGPDIDANLDYFVYPEDGAIEAGLSRIAALGDFKLIGSIWSPPPWLKVSSNNTYNQNWWPGPAAGTPWSFIWGGNFAGGRLGARWRWTHQRADAVRAQRGSLSSRPAAAFRGFAVCHQYSERTQFRAVLHQRDIPAVFAIHPHNKGCASRTRSIF